MRADTARPVAVVYRCGGDHLAALDDPGGPWLLRDGGLVPCLWLGSDGRVCDTRTRYGGRPSDVLAEWIVEQAGKAEGHDAIQLAPAQISERARSILGRKLARLARLGIVAAPAGGEADDDDAPADVAEPALTPARQVSLFGAKA